ncbi:hypothetical protein COC42_11980 [Sphingomonas spermidinifaciens]|uniref:Transcription regulator HTH AraC N-terminal domain-containing protein n=1 Tax=Sphingomonas spermidinifaciens TaxID=1141889 RepID=A0A2A4B320_9SPHN|nr:hypothetical protein COC42_11980 [Sphingomonas spermidinifaciens]
MDRLLKALRPCRPWISSPRLSPDTHRATAPGVRHSGGPADIRASQPTVPMPVIYEPTICFVAQGRKRVMLGDRPMSMMRPPICSHTSTCRHGIGVRGERGRPISPSRANRTEPNWAKPPLLIRFAMLPSRRGRSG